MSFKVQTITAQNTDILTRKERNIQNGSRIVFKYVLNANKDMKFKKENVLKLLLLEMIILSVKNGLLKVNVVNVLLELLWVMMEFVLQFLINVRNGMMKMEPVLVAMLDINLSREIVNLSEKLFDCL